MDNVLKRNVTISQIAKESKVSVSTVSRVLNNKPDVLPETRDRVLKVINAYDFHASAQARGIVKSRSNTIGLVVADAVNYVFMNQYFVQVLQGVIQETQRLGYYVLSLYCNDMDEALEAYQQQRVDGLLLLSPTQDHLHSVHTFLEREVPVVSIGSFPYCDGIPCIELDDYTGTEQAMEYLFSQGHQKIAYINGPGKVPSSSTRYQAYFDKMTQRGYEVLPDMVQSSHGVIDASEAVEAILQAVPDVTAIFAASDFVAIGTITALQNRGMRVPEEISVIGFDDVPMSSQVWPKLTTVRQNSKLKGRMAASVLIDWIESGKMPQQQYIIPTELIIRDSVTCYHGD